MVGIDMIKLTTQMIINPTKLTKKVFHHCELTNEIDLVMAFPNPFLSNKRIIKTIERVFAKKIPGMMHKTSPTITIINVTMLAPIAKRPFAKR